MIKTIECSSYSYERIRLTIELTPKTFSVQVVVAVES